MSSNEETQRRLAAHRANLSESQNAELTEILDELPEQRRREEAAVQAGRAPVTWTPTSLHEMQEIYLSGENSIAKQMEREGLGGLDDNDFERLVSENPNGEEALAYRRIVAKAFAAYREKYGLPEHLRH